MYCLSYYKSMTFLTRSKFQSNPYHLVENSPWPIVVSFALFALLTTLVLSMHFYISIHWVSIPFITTVASVVLWVRDIISEGTYLGCHTSAVKHGLNLGFLSFIGSETLLFAAFIWAYLHSSLSPTIELGMAWPYEGIEAIGPLDLPLLNTVILLCSGVSVTASHHYLISGNKKNTVLYLSITVFLGFTFLLCQFIEYSNATFTISDGVLPSAFYCATGLHFLHVFVGCLMLSTSLWRIIANQLTREHNLGFELAILYWHFVDVVWLVVYIVCYVYGS